MEDGVRFKVPLLDFGLFQADLFSLFSFGELLFLLLGEGSIIKVFSIACPRTSVYYFAIVFVPHTLVFFCELFFTFAGGLLVKLFQKLWVVFVDGLSLDLGLIPEFFELAAEY